MIQAKQELKFIIILFRDKLLRLRWAASYAIPLLIFLMSANFFMTHFAINDWTKIKNALDEITITGISLCFFLTSISYLALISYDLAALWKIGINLPLRIVFLASFSSFSLSFNLGFPIITGIGLRMHIYGREAITAAHIAHLSIINGITFWLGICISLAICLINSSDSLTLADSLPKHIHIFAGIILTVLLVFYYFWFSIRNRMVSFKDTFFFFPEAKITIAQCFIGTSEVFAASAALYVLLPHNSAYNYMDFTILYIVSCVAGIISHVPGGIGVFETVMMQTGSKISDANILGGLVVFRAIYYFIPFIISIILITTTEWPKITTAINSALRRYINK